MNILNSNNVKYLLSQGSRVVEFQYIDYWDHFKSSRWNSLKNIDKNTNYDNLSIMGIAESEKSLIIYVEQVSKWN